MKKIELLAPCGSFDALKAAIASRADAVYLGGSSFSARAFAKNFTDEEMIEAIRLAHLYNVKVYVTLNTLIYDHEFEDVVKYVAFLYNNEVDAVIVQDLGLMSVIRQYLPDLEIHASTQMTIHNIEGVKFLKSKGVHRVVLARENTIEDIKRINQSTDMETEVFVHGALCVCYSGQCLMSSLIGGRSGNRGRCAQPCRKLYNLYNNDILLEKGKYFLSPKDLNTIANIDKLIDAGVHSFKIEGRLKSPEYVAIVVSQYRKVIDEYLKSKTMNVLPEQLEELAQIFNRQFTRGFVFNALGNDFINLEKNNNTGLLCGRVIDSVNKKVKIKLTRDLSVNDGIYFANTDVGMTVSRIIRNQREEKMAKAGDIVIIDSIKDVPKRIDVYKTTDVLLNDKARHKYESINQLIPISIELELLIGKHPLIRISDDLLNLVIHERDVVIESSINQTISEERVKEQLSKLGNTPFFIENISLIMDKSAFIPISIINNLRREAIDKLINIRLKKYNRQKTFIPYKYTDEIIKSETPIHLNVYCHTEKQYEAAKQCGIKNIYLNEEINYSAKDDCIIAKERVQYSPQLSNTAKGILVSDLGTLNLVGDNMHVISNYNLNVTNSETIRFLKQNKVDIITLSHEMNESVLKNLRYNNKQDLEVIIYGYQEGMITKHCMFAENCKKQCKREAAYFLEDEKKEKFRVMYDANCHMHIMNSKLMILGEELFKLNKFGYRRYRIQLSVEDFSMSINVINAYKKLIYEENPRDVNELVDKYKSENLFTRGYFSREIL